MINQYEDEREKIIRNCMHSLASKTKTVIEFGCNNGTYTSTISSNFKSALSIDIDSKFIEDAKAKINSNNVEWLQRDLNQKIPENHYNKFDVAVAMEIIEHLDSPKQFLGEIRHCLREKGQLLLTTPNLMSLEALTGFYWSYRNKSKYTAWDKTHINLFTSIKIIKLLKENGFLPKQIIGFYYDSGILPIINRKLKIPLISSTKWPINRLGFNIIIIAETIT